MHCAILLNNLPLWNYWQHILSLLCSSLFFSPFDNKYKGVPWTPLESILIVSNNDRGKKKKHKVTPPEMLCPIASQCLGNVITPNFFCRDSKTSLGKGLVKISATWFAVEMKPTLPLLLQLFLSKNDIEWQCVLFLNA